MLTGDIMWLRVVDEASNLSFFLMTFIHVTYYYALYPFKNPDTVEFNNVDKQMHVMLTANSQTTVTHKTNNTAVSFYTDIFSSMYVRLRLSSSSYLHLL